EFNASSPSVQGLFILFDDALTAIDGGALTDVPSSRLIFPKVTAKTIISFVYTRPESINNAVLRLFDNGGRLLQDRVLTIEASSGFSGPLSDLISGADGYD